MLKQLTPILSVEAIEPCLSFWTDLLGFEKIAEVPEGDRLGFVILQRDGIQVMYQTYASLEKDLPGLPRGCGNFLYFDVDDVLAIEKIMPESRVVVPLRKTFYGATELWVKEPGGYVVGFAEHAAEA